MTTINATNPPPTTMESMAKERLNCPFDLRQMTFAMGGGKYDTELKERFMNVSRRIHSILRRWDTGLARISWGIEVWELKLLKKMRLDFTRNQS